MVTSYLPARAGRVSSNAAAMPAQPPPTMATFVGTCFMAGRKISAGIEPEQRTRAPGVVYEHAPNGYSVTLLSPPGCFGVARVLRGSSPCVPFWGLGIWYWSNFETKV